MSSYLASPSATRAVLERHGLSLKHKLGQNFLVNDHIIEKILALAELTSNECVLEVGPGIGTLSVALLEAGVHLSAIEADSTLVPVLGETCSQYLDRLTLIEGDALKVELSKLSPVPVKLVSNLPYQVAATFVLRAFEQIPSIQRAVVMVQAEVADRMCASPGTKAYGAYTAKLALYGKADARFEVAPANFMPAPHVNSAVVRINRVSAELSPHMLAATAQVIDAAFAQRRKTIRNSMASSGYSKEALDAAFETAAISPSVRAETLFPEDFVRLAGALAGALR